MLDNTLTSREDREVGDGAESGQTGLVFNIQRCSLQDGPGIRTVVFFKGCPLHCAWCCNPESTTEDKEISFDSERCIGDEKCLGACPSGARSHAGYDLSKCTLCGRCVLCCPSGALEMLGKQMTVQEVVLRVEMDRQFYEQSGGGITLSGGEVLLQWRFAAALISKLKQRSLHVAIETSGYGPWQHAKAVVKECDLILYDLKHMDPHEHLRYTGATNRLVLANARKMAQLGKELVFRIPLVGGVNCDPDNITKIADFADELGVKEVHLLPYHRLGVSKYRKLRKEYGLQAFAPDDTTLSSLRLILETRGLRVKVGG